MRILLLTISLALLLVAPVMASSIGPGSTVPAPSKKKRAASTPVLMKLEQVSGNLSRTEVHRVLAGLNERLEACYRRWPVTSGRRPEVDLVVNLEINAGGLNLLQVNRTSVGARSLEICLLHVLASAPFEDVIGSTRMTLSIARQAGTPELISISGLLDRDAIRRIIRQISMQSVWSCLAEGIDNEQADLLLELSIDRAGRAGLARIAPPSVARPSVLACLRQQISSWRFPRCRNGGSIKVKLPLPLRRKTR